MADLWNAPKVKVFNGWNMSLHPRGPQFTMVCPTCNRVMKVRTNDLVHVEGGMIGTCDYCLENFNLPLIFT